MEEGTIIVAWVCVKNKQLAIAPCFALPVQVYNEKCTNGSLQLDGTMLGACSTSPDALNIHLFPLLVDMNTKRNDSTPGVCYAVVHILVVNNKMGVDGPTLGNALSAFRREAAKVNGGRMKDPHRIKTDGGACEHDACRRSLPVTRRIVELWHWRRKWNEAIKKLQRLGHLDATGAAALSARTSAESIANTDGAPIQPLVAEPTVIERFLAATSNAGAMSELRQVRTLFGGTAAWRNGLGTRIIAMESDPAAFAKFGRIDLPEDRKHNGPADEEGYFQRIKQVHGLALTSERTAHILTRCDVQLLTGPRIGAREPFFNCGRCDKRDRSIRDRKYGAAVS